MKKEELGGYLDFLCRKARTIAGDGADAEDLVSETVLRAMRFLDRDGEIANPAAWLSGTLSHVWNDHLRRKYRSPVFVELTDDLPIPQEEDDGFSALWESDEGEAVRREVNRLVSEYRRTVILFYWRSLSVAEIASRLGIPEGTVKSRLDSGRKKIRKGLEKNMKQTHRPGEDEKIPETLLFSNAGVAGPSRMIDGDLLAQNILIEAYKKPLALPELSKRLGVPTAYVEPVARRLCDCEFMARTPGGLWYTDFIIFSPGDSEGGFDAQLSWVKERFERIWPALDWMKAEMEKTPWWDRLNGSQRHKALYHAALLSLQRFTHECAGASGDWEPYYKRKTWKPGWLGWGYRFPAEYDFEAKAGRDKWRILGGLRTSAAEDIPGVRSVALMEFDTAFFDRTAPYRYELAPWHAFKRLLWRAYQGEDPSSDRGIPTSSVEAIPKYIEYGLLARDPDGTVVPDIPVLKNTEYNDLYERICRGETVSRIDKAVGEDFRAFVSARAAILPPHLKSVPESLRLHEASSFAALAVLREAHRRGLFLKDAPDPCPPVVFAWME